VRAIDEANHGLPWRPDVAIRLSGKAIVMRQQMALAALLAAFTLVGCKKNDAGSIPQSPPNGAVTTTATPASSPASDPSLPDAASAMASQASSASAP
jgi:hypothetical protein